MTDAQDNQKDQIIANLRKALDELTLRNEALLQLASRDELTGLPNRRSLNERFSQESARAERYDRPFSIILFDIDSFKTVNDRSGHPAGDIVLKKTAKYLQGTLRASDYAGRWGGDEFLILCPETSLEQAVQLAERLRRSYETIDFQQAGRLSGSFGVATHSNGCRARDLLKSVDEALYRAKNSGRNRVEQTEN